MATREMGSDLAVVGPTATGKTALALELARRVTTAELVSVDSMAVYRELDIGTSKPGGLPPWHLVDLVDPSEEFSVAQFQEASRDAISGIHERGHLALIVGGTGLYHRAVTDGLDLPGRYPGVAADLELEAETAAGVEILYSRLSELDPVAAGRIEPSNRRRIVRALEVTVGSGRRFSTYGPGLTNYPAGHVRMAGLALDRSEVDKRLEDRLDQQLASGWLEEVRRLAGRPGGLARTARQAIGYRELLDHLAGLLSLEEARVLILRRLKSFARRQESWFRRDPRVHWFDAASPDLAEEVLAFWSVADRQVISANGPL